VRSPFDRPFPLTVPAWRRYTTDIDGCRERRDDGLRVTYSEEQDGSARRSGPGSRRTYRPRLTREPKDAAESLDLYLQRRELAAGSARRGALPGAPREYRWAVASTSTTDRAGGEADRLDLSLPPFYDTGGTLGAPSILVWGSTSRSRPSWPRFYRGDVRVLATALRAGAGSDLAGVRTQQSETATST